MAANKLNADEARSRINNIGTLVGNLVDSLHVCRFHAQELYDRSAAKFVQDVKENLDELYALDSGLKEAHTQLKQAFEKYAEQHAEMAGSL